MRKSELIRITPREMFDMIENFADGLLDYMDSTLDGSERSLMMEVSEKILNIMKDCNVEGRIAIIIMLQNAVAMYRIGCEQSEIPSCPPEYLN